MNKYIVCIVLLSLFIIAAITVILYNTSNKVCILGADLSDVYKTALKNDVDIIPNEETAIAVAKAILEPIYGKIERNIKVQFYDKLGLWVVWCDNELTTNQISPDRVEVTAEVGNELYVFIQKKDGKASIVYYK